MSDSEPEEPQILIKPEPQGKTRRKPSQVVSSDDEDQDQDAPTSSSSTSANKNKRIKLDNNRNGNKRVHESDNSDVEQEQEEEEVEAIKASKSRGGEKAQLIRDESGYVTGSILRIACQSFLTYDQVEFKPGPSLNMIIGPNGTGKSTIACAIAIGLGFPAKVLGRSTKLSSYCKNDSNQECWIELELKGKPGDKNLIVRRVLSRDSEKSTFYLNGALAKAQEVGERMEGLSVQVGNLCTFLPQDRVASFAMMGHSELLIETEKAAGDVNLSSWHQILIDEYKLLKEKQINVETYTKKLNKVLTKQSEASKEVEQFEQRQIYENDVIILNILFKYAKYNKVFTELQDFKSVRNRLENEVKELEAKNKPFKDSKELLKMISQNSTSAVSTLEKKLLKSNKLSSKKKEQVEKNTKDSLNLQEELRDLKVEEEQLKKVIKEAEKKINRLKLGLEGKEEPREADTTEIDLKIAEKGEEKRSKDEQINELRTEIGLLERNLRRLDQDRQNLIGKLEYMKKATAVREENTARHDPQTWQAIQWLRSNKEKFKGQVYEPARITIFPKYECRGKKLDSRNPEILKLIEAPISNNAFRCFLFELREDYDFFMREMADTRGLKLVASELGKVEPIRRALNEQQLDELGFDVLACDMLNGPEPVIRWLANEHSLGRTPLQLFNKPLDYQKISRIARQINRYYTFEGSVSTKFSNYGDKKAMTESRALAPSKVLSTGVDEEKVKSIEQDLNRILEEMKKLKEKIDKNKLIGREIYEQVKILDEEKSVLVTEKQKVGEARRTWHKAQAQLVTAERELTRALDNQKRDSRGKRRAEIARDIKKSMVKRVKLALEYKDHILEAEQLEIAATKLRLQAIQADSDHRAMEALVRERDEELERAQNELRDVKADLKELIKEGKELMEQAQSAIDDAEDPIKVEVEKRRRQENPETMEQIEAQRDEITAKLDCMISVSGAVVEAFKKRKDEIATLEQQVEEAEETLQDSKNIIETTKADWLPKLKSLVQDISKRFTASFDTLGLMGEVRLAEDEDYEKWGIEIMVSFRDKDSEDVTLHVLSGQRQSGGERALTTVTYLLALAELARAPFALVDEINQGMDQRAERNMHKMLVETTCKDDVGQYFLLTPKLLPDLVYHEKMKVLVINSGSFIPEDLSLKALVERRRKLNKESGRLGRIAVPPV